MHPDNIKSTIALAKKFKEVYPNKTIWSWTGFLFDRDLKDQEVLKYLDVLVDGFIIIHFEGKFRHYCGFIIF